MPDIRTVHGKLGGDISDIAEYITTETLINKLMQIQLKGGGL